ncbi:MAG TPA: hypothetical protein VMU25_03910 [Candidatus Paceibacterota bacterium]|nr:hypothetical protein [Candidatus Paceibacterota bacterium]
MNIWEIGAVVLACVTTAFYFCTLWVAITVTLIGFALWLVLFKYALEIQRFWNNIFID